MPKSAGLSAIESIVVVMLENRSFDHMLGYLYSRTGNKSPLGQPFDGLTGNESNSDRKGNPVKVSPIDHLEQVYADSVSRLPVADEKGHAHPQEVDQFKSGKEAMA